MSLVIQLQFSTLPKSEREEQASKKECRECQVTSWTPLCNSGDVTRTHIPRDDDDEQKSLSGIFQ